MKLFPALTVPSRTPNFAATLQQAMASSQSSTAGNHQPASMGSSTVPAAIIRLNQPMVTVDPSRHLQHQQQHQQQQNVAAAPQPTLTTTQFVPGAQDIAKGEKFDVDSPSFEMINDN